jgi:hypothetical protein
MDIIIVQSNCKSYLTPIKVHRVIVPGPINAAAINGPGPTFLKKEFSTELGFVLKVVF